MATVQVSEWETSEIDIDEEEMVFHDVDPMKEVRDLISSESKADTQQTLRESIEEDFESEGKRSDSSESSDVSTPQLLHGY